MESLPACTWTKSEFEETIDCKVSDNFWSMWGEQLQGKKIDDAILNSAKCTPKRPKRKRRWPFIFSNLRLKGRLCWNKQRVINVWC